MKREKRLKHALHNQELCRLLHENANFCDWVITSALHFVSWKIFPLNDRDAKGNKFSYISLDDYYSFGNRVISKHQTLSDLVYNHIPEISPDYDWLMDLCLTARYKDYDQPKDQADKAITLLEAIKKACRVPLIE